MLASPHLRPMDFHPQGSSQKIIVSIGSNQVQPAFLKVSLHLFSIYASLSLILFRAHTFFSDEEN
jgi:hypothetical protein